MNTGSCSIQTPLYNAFTFSSHCQVSSPLIQYSLAIIVKRVSEAQGENMKKLSVKKKNALSMGHIAIQEKPKTWLNIKI